MRLLTFRGDVWDGWATKLCFSATVNRISIGRYQATRDTNGSGASRGNGPMQMRANELRDERRKLGKETSEWARD